MGVPDMTLHCTGPQRYLTPNLVAIGPKLWICIACRQTDTHRDTQFELCIILLAPGPASPGPLAGGRMAQDRAYWRTVVADQAVVQGRDVGKHASHQI